jgi:ferric-dicitrate binding protein FerR (iron transport regulator)
MTEHRLVLLVIGKLADELDTAETDELDNWTAESAEHARFLEVFTNENLLTMELDRFAHIDVEKGYAKVQALIEASRRAKVIRMTALSAACTILVVAGVLLIKQLSTHRLPAATEASNSSSIAPGRTTFTVRDSSGGYKILSTPRAGKFEVGLPDGSHVWLNDSTTLRYPRTFSGSSRTVMLTGEAYFEIAKDASRPFLVRSNSVSVEAPGTSFDCSSYPGEAATITLLNGRVSVRTANASASLKPKERAIVKTDGSLSVDTNVSAASIAAWKEGYFFFNHTLLDQVKRQLARWYDIPIVDASGRPGVLFYGKIDRRVPLDELLKKLNDNQTQLTFHLENRKLIILSR